jgi:hypothetical protein
MDSTDTAVLPRETEMRLLHHIVLKMMIFQFN